MPAPPWISVEPQRAAILSSEIRRIAPGGANHLKNKAESGII
jgi:hypothetical protein